MTEKIFANITIITLLTVGIPNVALASNNLPWGRFVPALILIPIVWLIISLTSKNGDDKEDK